MIEGGFVDLRRDLGARAAGAPPFVGDDHFSGLLGGGDNGFEIERIQGSQIDNLGVDAALLKRFGRRQRIVHALGVSDDGEVLAFAQHRGLSKWYEKILVVRNLAFDSVERFVLQKHHRIVPANRGFEQALGVGRGCRNRHAQARAMQKVRLQALAVLGAQLMAPALRGTNHQRHLGLAAEHVVDFGRVVDDLIHREQAEIYGHQLDYRLESAHRGANPCAHYREFRNRSVPHPFLAVHGQQSVGDLEGTAEVADFLAHDKHALVAVEFLAQRDVESFAIADLCHWKVRSGTRVDTFAQFLDRGLGTFVRKLYRVLDLAGHGGFDFAESRLRDVAFAEHAAAEILDGIALLPDAFLALGAVLGRVRHRVAAEAIGDGFN